MSPLNFDNSIFAVIVRMRGEPVMIERTLEDAASLPQTVIDIARGQIEDVEAIIEFNPVEGWSRIITADVAEQIARIINADFDHDGKRPHWPLKNFVEKHSSIRLPRAA